MNTHSPEDSNSPNDDGQFTGGGVVGALFCACCFITGVCAGLGLSALFS